ncbi:sulfatase [Flexithrix dorotheae]|uniref:sulfatase n=1 Tax=Flexithrix dorotheae TaxID=70993 RepID=UPI00039B3B1E|nr:sulfatase [Flexithrix dorotheae]
MILKTYLLYFLGILILSSCSKNGKTKKEDNRPNIILIMADDLGYGELSCYGSSTLNTPNLDALAAGGMKFTDFHSNGPVCSPTRAALMTGMYQQRTGVEGVITAANHREVGLSLNETTLAEELLKLGYACGMYGKWHLGYAEKFNPTYQGFEDFAGFVSGNVDYHSHIDQEGYFDWWINKALKDEKGYTTDLITQHGIDYIRKNNPSKTGKPFFLYLSQEAPHYPIQGRNDKPVRKEGSGKYIRKVPKDSTQIIYKEMIETMDEGVGDVMQALTDEGLVENTIVIFCSDNGAAAGRGDSGGLRSFKASIYEGGHRVPAIISYQGKIRSGQVNHDQVMSMDFLPTLVDFAGGTPTHKNIDGISIKDMLLNETILPKRDLFWSFKNRKAMRSGKWKLIVIPRDGKEVLELYDLENDLAESVNLADEEPELVKEMQQKLIQWENEVRTGVETVSN